MIKLEYITKKDLKSNVKNNNIFYVVNAIEPQTGNYIIHFNVNFFPEAIWWGTYKNYQKITLKNGHNLIKISIEPDEPPFSFGFCLKKNSKLQIFDFMVDKLPHFLERDTSDILPYPGSNLPDLKQNLEISEQKQIPQKRISIVMSNINRRSQLEFTLKTISYSAHKNIEIIVWDDCSVPEEKIDDFVEKYGIKLVTVTNKTWVNPVVGYNNAIMMATGDIVLIQNPEVCHLDDILQYVNQNLEPNDCFSFSCYALANIDENNKMKNLLNPEKNFNLNKQKYIESFIHDKQIAGNTIHNEPINGWVNHPVYLPVAYHYACALYRDKLLEMGGFDNDYQNGFCHDDDDFVRRLGKHQLTVTIVNKYCVHQWHPSQIKVSNAPELWKKNQKVFWHKMLSYGYPETVGIDITKKLLAQIDWPKKIPKKIHFYWNGNQFTILHLLTLKSFILFNPDWKIYVYSPLNSSEYVAPWQTSEQKYVYTGKSYLDEIKSLNIERVAIDFEKIGFTNDANDVFKSDYLRWYLLYTYGGCWADFDILFLNKFSMDIFKTGIKNCNLNDIETGIYFFDGVFPIGLLFASENNSFFKICYENSLKYFDKGGYQSMGATMWFHLFRVAENVLKNYNNICILNKNTVYPYRWNEINAFFEETDEKSAIASYDKIINGNVFGIHWYNGAASGKQFCSNEININSNSVVCKLLLRMENLKWRNKYLDFLDYHFIPFHKFNTTEKAKFNNNIRKTFDFCKNHNYTGFNADGSLSISDPKFDFNIDIMQKYSGCYVNKNVYPRISIVCVHNNNKESLLQTLNSIKLSVYKNVEVIIIDVNPNQKNNIDQIILEYPFIIKINKLTDASIDNKYRYYDIGINYTIGDVIIFQNSSIYHATDIINYIYHNIDKIDKTDFVSIPSFTLKKGVELTSNIKSNLDQNKLNFDTCFSIHRNKIEEYKKNNPQYENSGFFNLNFVEKIKNNSRFQVAETNNFWVVQQA